MQHPIMGGYLKDVEGGGGHQPIARVLSLNLAIHLSREPGTKTSGSYSGSYLRRTIALTPSY